MLAGSSLVQCTCTIIIIHIVSCKWKAIMTIYDGLIEMRKAGMNSTSLIFVNMISPSFLIQPIMNETCLHNVSVWGSSHVSCASKWKRERSDVTSVSRALAHARVMGPLGTWWGDGRSMGMTLGCSTSLIRDGCFFINHHHYFRIGLPTIHFFHTDLTQFFFVLRVVSPKVFWLLRDLSSNTDTVYSPPPYPPFPHCVLHNPSLPFRNSIELSQNHHCIPATTIWHLTFEILSSWFFRFLRCFG